MQALKRVVGAAVALELAGLGGTYYGFHRLNTDPEFRVWVDTNCPSVLDGFCAAVQAVGRDLPEDLRLRQERRAVKSGGENR
jgi:hypothetical protein